MGVNYPLFVFEKDDQSMRLIEDSTRLSYHLEAIDIVNDEYVFWDANGNGVSVTASVTTFKGKIGDATSCVSHLPLRDAFSLYAKTLGLAEIDLDGTPSEVWRRIQQELESRPKKRGFLSSLFSK
jgi:hypothetical protein